MIASAAMSSSGFPVPAPPGNQEESGGNPDHDKEGFPYIDDIDVTYHLLLFSSGLPCPSPLAGFGTGISALSGQRLNLDHSGMSRGKASHLHLHPQRVMSYLRRPRHGDPGTYQGRKNQDRTSRTLPDSLMMSSVEYPGAGPGTSALPTQRSAAELIPQRFFPAFFT